jgi:hypothetical protein
MFRWVVILTDLKICGGLSWIANTDWSNLKFALYIRTAWRQRNSKHFLIWWLINFLQIYFIFARIFARFCKFQKLSRKENPKESAKRRDRADVNEGKFATAFAYMKQLNKTVYNFSVSLIDWFPFLLYWFFWIKKKAKLFACENLKSFYCKLKVYR